jgi:hypothetical protein
MELMALSAILLIFAFMRLMWPWTTAKGSGPDGLRPRSASPPTQLTQSSATASRPLPICSRSAHLPPATRPATAGKKAPRRALRCAQLRASATAVSVRRQIPGRLVVAAPPPSRSGEKPAWLPRAIGGPLSDTRLRARRPVLIRQGMPSRALRSLPHLYTERRPGPGQWKLLPSDNGNCCTPRLSLTLALCVWPLVLFVLSISGMRRSTHSRSEKV